MRKILESCPTCGGALVVSEVSCTACDTVVRSRYTPCPFCRLDPEDLAFMLLFVRSRGNVKDMERELGVSYWTIRGRLNELIAAMGLGGEDEEPPSPNPSPGEGDATALVPSPPGRGLGRGPAPDATIPSPPGRGLGRGPAPDATIPSPPGRGLGKGPAPDATIPSPPGRGPGKGPAPDAAVPSPPGRGLGRGSAPDATERQSILARLKRGDLTPTQAAALLSGEQPLTE